MKNWKLPKLEKKIYVRMVICACFLIMIAGNILLQKVAIGQNYFVVTVNNKIIGQVNATVDVEEAMHTCRRNLAAQTDGYLMQKMEYQIEETSKPFVSLMGQQELETKIQAELESEQKALVAAYTVQAGDNQISFATLEEVSEFLSRIKGKADREAEYTIAFEKADDHEAGSMIAKITRQEAVQEEASKPVVILAKHSAEMVTSAPAASGQDVCVAGVNAQIASRLTDAVNSESGGNYETGIVDMTFAEDVKVFSNQVAPESLTTIDAAVEEVTKDKETNKIYEIQPGDCLSVIAEENDTTVDSIVALNGFANDQVAICAGDEIILSVPQPDIALCVSEAIVYEEDYEASPTIVPNDSWYTSDEVVLVEGTSGHREVNAVVTYENGVETSRTTIHQTIMTVSTPAVIERGTQIPPTYIKPLAGGRLSSPFGRRWGKMHKGVDWACPTGTTVYASCNGVVASAGYVSGYGNCVLISHPDGRMTRYAHNSKLLVKAGHSVAQGEPIALSGSTGHSTGPHVHFEILINGSQVNPLEYLN